MLEMPHAIIVDKKNILFETVIFDTRTIKEITKDTNLVVEATIILLGITDPMTDPDPEIEASPVTEITTALDTTDPGAEVNLVIDTEITETIVPLTDQDLAIDHLLPILVMFIPLTPPMITPMNNLKLSWLMKLLELLLPII